MKKIDTVARFDGGKTAIAPLQRRQLRLLNRGNWRFPKKHLMYPPRALIHIIL